MHVRNFKLNHAPSKSQPHLNKHKHYAAKHFEHFRRKKLQRLTQNKPPAPASFSLSKFYTLFILNQLNLGTCVVNSYAAIIQSVYGILPSRLYCYFNARIGDKICPKNDSGLDLLKARPYLLSFGLVPETKWPYNVTAYATLPPYLPTYKISDIKTKVNMVSISQTAGAIKNELQNKHFIMFGILIYDSFFTDNIAINGIVSVPKTSVEKEEGGHCMNIVGWLTLQNTLYFICRNSWGKEWGNDGNPNPPLPFNFVNNGSNGGFCYIPASYILNPKLAFEFFAVW
jgi:hypothetical protein